MSPECFSAEELARVLEVDPGDPRRRHLDECPRCRARLRAFQTFMAPPDVPEGADPRDAQRRLDAVVDALGKEPARPRAVRGRSSLPEWLTGPVWRPALAAAAVLVVASVLVATLTPRRELVLRGLPGDGARAELRLEAARVTGVGTELRWSPVPGEVRYRVDLFGSDLREIARLAPTPETRLVVTRSMVPDGVVAGTTLLWRVTALTDSGLVAVSPVGSLRAP
jgi:hypothetical protein